jgi:6,7-dimethyl-8-ribityllumazine synthase
MQKIHIIVSEFNNPIPDALLEGSLQAFKDLGINKGNLVITKVPGAFELPLAAKLAAQLPTTDAVICLGAVIRGDTSHYDYVCSETSRGIMQVGLETLKPVIFGLLTTENEEQAHVRSLPNKTNKGYECAMAAMKMIEIKETLIK